MDAPDLADNIVLLGPTDQGGRGDGGQVMVGDGHAYVGHMFSDGVTVLDVRDPRDPRPPIAGTWWLPGMHLGGGERPAWPSEHRYGLHHAIVADEGIADGCADQVKYTWVFDVREPVNPVSIATLPAPSEVGYCAKGGHFGPHNRHENRPGSFVSDQPLFPTYQNAGVRVFDLANPSAPREVGAFVPPAPRRMYDTRPDRPRVIQSCDVFVDREGIMDVTDHNAGLYVLQYEPGAS